MATIDLVRFLFLSGVAFLGSLSGIAAAASLPGAALATPPSASSKFFPPDFVNHLRKHGRWLTIPYMKVTLPNSFQVFSGTPKKWLLKIDSTQDPVLEETTKLSLREDPEHPGAAQWYSESVNAVAPIQISKIYSDFPKYRDIEWMFQELGDDKFAIVSPNGFINVVFIPVETPSANSTKFLVQEPSPKNSFAATAPFGFSEDAYAHYGLSVETRHYLHHDSSIKKSVRVSKTFPKRYYTALINSLKQWNSALNFDLFDLTIQESEIDPSSCLGSEDLCLYWNGPEELPWTGIVAVTAISFDPEVGRIVGGLITVTNTASSSALVPTPAETVSTVTESPSLKWIVGESLKRDEYSRYVHPFPENLLSYFLLHELGHYNGLKHNFAGSVHGTFENPSDSIMDYLPFPVVFKANAIGYYDRSMLNLIYSGLIPDSKQPYCSDYQTTGKEWVPYCDQRDMSDTLQWYDLMAGASGDGLLAVLNTISPADDEHQIQEPLVDALLRYFDTPDAEWAKQITCEHMSDKVQDYLKAKNVKISCGK